MRTLSPSDDVETIHGPGQSSDRNGDISLSLKPLSLSILGVEPIDEFITEVADWIYGLIVNRPSISGQIEVEAKLGVLKYKDGNRRLNHPVRVETSK